MSETTSVPYYQSEEKQRQQTFFDLSWATLAQMTHQSSVRDAERCLDKCLYTAPDGNHCVIGARIPAELYQPEMDQGAEGLSVGDLFCQFPEVLAHFQQQGWTTKIDLLNAIQCVHDSHFDERLSYLAQVADRFQLTRPVSQPLPDEL